MIDYGEARCARCARCGDPHGQYVYGPMMHPGTYYCERCLVEMDTLAARKAVAKLPELESRLAALGGEAERILCGYVNIAVHGDPTPFGAFCELDSGHTGYHKAVE